MYWDFNWRKEGGATRMVEISKRERFYRQEYCGCVYSLRDTNRDRLKKGIGRIQIGLRYYGDENTAPREPEQRQIGLARLAINTPVVQSSRESGS